MTTKTYRYFAFALLFLLRGLNADAQFLKARIGVNGLTCSQCSRSVEMQLRKLNFVSKVQMDLEHTNGTILFKEGSTVDISAIAKAVQDAGFSVRYLKAEVESNQLNISGDNCFKLHNNVYYLLQPLNNAGQTVTLQFMDKDYAQKKDLKNYKMPERVKCRGTKLYHVVAVKN